MRWGKLLSLAWRSCFSKYKKGTLLRFSAKAQQRTLEIKVRYAGANAPYGFKMFRNSLLGF
jgi:hypothetical protein